MNVHNKVNIMSVGFNESSNPARKGVAFIRSNPVLWTIAGVWECGLLIHGP